MADQSIQVARTKEGAIYMTLSAEHIAIGADVKDLIIQNLENPANQGKEFLVFIPEKVLQRFVAQVLSVGCEFQTFNKTQKMYIYGQKVGTKDAEVNVPLPPSERKVNDFAVLLLAPDNDRIFLKRTDIGWGFLRGSTEGKDLFKAVETLLLDEMKIELGDSAPMYVGGSIGERGRSDCLMLRTKNLNVATPVDGNRGDYSWFSLADMRVVLRDSRMVLPLMGTYVHKTNIFVSEDLFWLNSFVEGRGIPIEPQPGKFMIGSLSI